MEIRNKKAPSLAFLLSDVVYGALIKKSDLVSGEHGENFEGTRL